MSKRPPDEEEKEESYDVDVFGNPTNFRGTQRRGTQRPRIENPFDNSGLGFPAPAPAPISQETSPYPITQQVQDYTEGLFRNLPFAPAARVPDPPQETDPVRITQTDVLGTPIDDVRQVPPPFDGMGFSVSDPRAQISVGTSPYTQAQQAQDWRRRFTRDLFGSNPIAEISVGSSPYTPAEQGRDLRDSYLSYIRSLFGTYPGGLPAQREETGPVPPSPSPGLIARGDNERQLALDFLSQLSERNYRYFQDYIRRQQEYAESISIQGRIDAISSQQDPIIDPNIARQAGSNLLRMIVISTTTGASNYLGDFFQLLIEQANTLRITFTEGGSQLATVAGNQMTSFNTFIDANRQEIVNLYTEVMTGAITGGNRFADQIWQIVMGILRGIPTFSDLPYIYRLYIVQFLLIGVLSLYVAYARYPELRERLHTGIADGQGAFAAGAQRGRDLIAAGAQRGRDLIAAGAQRGRDLIATGAERGRDLIAAGAERGRHVIAAGLDRSQETIDAVQQVVTNIRGAIGTFIATSRQWIGDLQQQFHIEGGLRLIAGLAGLAGGGGGQGVPGGAAIGGGVPGGAAIGGGPPVAPVVQGPAPVVPVVPGPAPAVQGPAAEVVTTSSLGSGSGIPPPHGGSRMKRRKSRRRKSRARTNKRYRRRFTRRYSF